jgi:hypothetical protein
MSFSILTFNQNITNLPSVVKIDLVIFYESLYGFSHIVDLRELNEQRNQVYKLSIFGIIIP